MGFFFIRAIYSLKNKSATALALAFLSTSCVSSAGFVRPMVEECTLLATREMFCIYGDQEEVRETRPSMILISPNDRKVLEDYLDSIEKRLRKCLNSRKTCK